MTATKLQACSACRTRFNGFRCPNCGKPVPLVGALVVLVLMIAILSLVGSLIPGERVPRVVERDDGATEYCIQSLREAMLWPVGVILFIGICTGYALFTRPRKSAKRQDSSTTTTGKIWRRIKTGIGWTLAALVVAFLGLILLRVVVVNPLRAFRLVVVDRESVEFHALLRSWSIPKSQVARMEIVRTERTSRRKPLVDLEFVVHDKRGRSYYSAEVQSLSPGEPRLAEYTELLERLKADLDGQPIAAKDARVNAHDG